ncbi:hypothetical protein AB0C47_06045 [Micromonospora taraxaci]|uniref:hypothetical protein n=1 Tax=Micromonospora taraxaci TaxID=1316803 RepID=UPI003410A424
MPVGLAFEGSVAELPPAYKEELRNGLGVVAAEISESAGGRPVTVSVLNLTYQECDFQVEGLAVAMCRWAEQEFGLASHRVDESFDRERNRYVFDWH